MSKNPGRTSVHSAKVRMGIWRLSSVPALVVLIPPPWLALLAEWFERTINCRGTHTSDVRLDRDGELAQCLAAAQSVQQFGQERRQAFRTDAIGRQQ